MLDRRQIEDMFLDWLNERLPLSAAVPPAPRPQPLPGPPTPPGEEDDESAMLGALGGD